MKGGKKSRKTRAKWVKLEEGFYKFNVDKQQGVTMRLIFSESIGVMESNEAELTAIRRVIHL